MMNDDLGRFMSEEERKQMDEIIGRAMQRKAMGKEGGTHFMTRKQRTTYMTDGRLPKTCKKKDYTSAACTL